ncbi:hypothetical protein AJ78_03359 [Emergomyces pasteurianus Ep9510]|uniref:Uncharacterized protein n=1 Tax=Emergomyces pasteurianus Ep9510 TaxID=1447872 RepID=A0A1J9QKR1_9EURO|nr:hypothetical protein AJ78_03359 [Emergomyces pasteurianus Ep9510]
MPQIFPPQALSCSSHLSSELGILRSAVKAGNIASQWLHQPDLQVKQKLKRLKASRFSSKPEKWQVIRHSSWVEAVQQAYQLIISGLAYTAEQRI